MNIFPIFNLLFHPFNQPKIKKMANQNAFLLSVYGVNQNQVGTEMGTTMSFPSTQVLVRPATAVTGFNGTFNGVTMNSVVQLLSNGTVVNQPQYYTPKTVAEVNTLQNT